MRAAPLCWVSVFLGLWDATWLPRGPRLRSTEDIEATAKYSMTAAACVSFARAMWSTLSVLPRCQHFLVSAGPNAAITISIRPRGTLKPCSFHIRPSPEIRKQSGIETGEKGACPTSLLPLPKPLITFPSSRSGKGGSGPLSGPATGSRGPSGRMLVLLAWADVRV